MPSIAAQNPKSDENSHRIRPTYAYATLITRDSYLEGVQCLKRSLSRVNSIYPLIVMFTPDSLSPDAVACLQGEGCILYPVTRYLPHKEFEYSYKCPEYAECWTKLQLWKLDQYFHRLMYLDADMVVMKNIDNLFTDLSHKHFYAVPDCAFGRTTEEERNNCSMGAYLKCTNDDAPNSLYFNAGFFLMTPSIGQFCEFEKILESTSCPAIIKGYAEQDFLNHYFQNEWIALPPQYNLQKGIKKHHPAIWNPHDAAIIHYTDAKPWHDRDHPENVEHTDIVDIWWRIFNSVE